MNEEKSVVAQAEKIFALPSKELATQMQLNTLLSAFNMVGMFVVNVTAEDRVGGPIDGGAKMAAETSLVGICARLDALMADADRWSVDINKTMEKALANAYQENANMLKEQADAFRHAHAPSTLYNPKIFKLPTGAWIAIVGDHTTEAGLDKAVIGMGTTPQEALDAFDKLFNGMVPEDLQQCIEEQQKQLENEQNQLDPGANKNPEKNEGRRARQRRNKQGPGQDAAGSPQQAE